MAAPFFEFAGNKRLLWIAEEWRRYSTDLAKWAMKRIVNRRDVWSQYTLKNTEISVVMLPIPERRALGTDMVTLKKLQRHFAGEARGHLIGLHSISDHSTCKWFAIDIDLHNEKIVNADEAAATNLAAALEWARRLREQGMDPMILDSNGVGGYHIWVLLDREYSLARTYDFADDLRSDYAELGLPRKPEIFPPKRVVKPGDLPYTLRLPGRHHTRPHYTRVWNFDAADENEWLEGGEAIEAMMATVPSKLPRPKPAREKNAAQPAKPKPAKAAKRKPRICVDLDGVLADYHGWEGLDHIGAPLAGALEFARELAESADIVIFTTRCSAEPDERNEISPLTPGQARIRVIDWLEKHGFPYADVYMGEGKPRAAAFIDDRAISCRPQHDKDAFRAAIKAAKSLLSHKRST